MGSPDFAVPSLEILLAYDFNVVAVVTATDKKGGRGGKKLLQTAVKQCADKHNIPVLQPKNLKSPKFVDKLRSFNADLQIVVAFRMLPEIVWNMPKYGTYNLHGSLLPQYRGAAPINWAVINGEKVTGVTSFKLKHAIDTGDYMLQREIEIGNNETAGELYNRMMHIGAEVILDTVNNISNEKIELHPQDDSKVSKAPKIYHDTCRIDWAQETTTIFNFIRGLSPYPVAWTMIDGLKLKIYSCDKVITNKEEKPGSLRTDNKTYIHITCNDGYLSLLQIQLQGKRAMNIKDFLNGFDIKDQNLID